MKKKEFYTTKKEKNIGIAFIFLIFVLMLIGTLFDQKISNILITNHSIFSHIFEHYTVQGKNFVYLICFEIITWIIWRLVKEHILRIILTTGLVLIDLNQMRSVLYDYVFYTAAVLHNHKIGQSWADSFNTSQLVNPKLGFLFDVLSIFFTFVCSYYFHKWIQKQSQDELDYSLRAALAGIFVIVAVSTSLETLKELWGRARPRDLSTIMGTGFSAWYKINPGTEYRSFPSGHSTLSWFYLYLPFLVPRKNIKWQRILTWLAVFIGVCSAYGRVRLGAHWLTDVTIATFIVVLAVYTASRFLDAHFVEHPKH
ncbi:phosphatase PAP2 family protein [Fructobacillus parabroussonetiae]|uniref:Phosphatase PAP2 family protein n=1 Tax=Fructobacillus parabroussonetiae TaxID=2713174 RepID=A0ABS5QXA5_9LACO|nr:phosphatase PAP2 family protein [Fructobacillus parabroussonetiae]MBS9337751.1 phosphatase PAP2 family protein [Fructobacillus parabroussonetiae]